MTSHGGPAQILPPRICAHVRARNFQPVPTSELLGSSEVGGDWLRQEIQFACVQDRSGKLRKKSQTLSANKTARGVLSPIQVANLGLAIA